MTTDALEETLVTVFNSLMEDIHTCLPGSIESYSYETQKATVKPLIKKKYLDGTVLELPVLVNVPITFPRTKMSGITFPVNKGDGVLLMFTERALERWYSSGKDSEPGDRRKFDISDAIGIIGCFSFADKNLASNNADVEIHHKEQKIVIKSNGDIELGIASLKKLVTEDIFSKFNTHVHTASSLAAATSGPQEAATYPAPMVLGDSEATTKVKGQ